MSALALDASDDSQILDAYSAAVTGAVDKGRDAGKGGSMAAG